MRTANKHSDALIGKSVGVWITLDLISGMDKLNDFLTSKYINDSVREEVFKILRVISFATILEGNLISLMGDQFKDLGDAEKDRIRNVILGKIKRFRRVKTEAEAEQLLEEQLSKSREVIIPPVLQYLAGYSMGELIGFARDYFTFESDLLTEFTDFKDKRDFVIHNPISTREDIEDNLKECIRLGTTLKQKTTELIRT